MNRSRSSILNVSAVVVFCCVLFAGCDDPLQEFISFHPQPTEITLTRDTDERRYEWPMTRNGYVIAKPPPMAYVTSFDKPLAVPDPVAAKLVPWSDDELHPSASELLHHAYDPPETELDVKRTLPRDLITGRHAFDVSFDGERMVTVEGKGLGLYRVADGSLIGHLKLPAGAAKYAINAVRFCGQSQDLMIASTDKIFRISSKDGTIAAESKGCGAEIQKWIINSDDTTMILLTTDGKLFGGDTGLEFFSTYSPGKDLTFEDVGLSSDGKRINVIIDGVPRTYFQDNYQIIDQVDLEGHTLSGSVRVAGGISTDGWINGHDLVYSFAQQGGTRKVDGYGMLWRPLWISCCSEEPGTHNWFLTIGSRFKDGKQEFVLFELGPTSRNHSVGHVLAESPDEIRHSRDGGEVAILDSRGLHLCKRRVWQSLRAVFLPQQVYNLVDEGKFDQIQQVCDIISKQDRLGYGLSSGEMASMVIYEVAQRWKYLEKNEPDSEILQGLETWYQQASHLARTASGIRHYLAGWAARGSGTMETVTQAGWETFTKRIKLAMADLDQAVKDDRPSLAALNYRISAGLESSDGLDGVNALCRRAAELYPDTSSVSESVCFKLLPQWFGEPGDAVSFALSSSRIVESPAGDLIYARLVGSLTNHVFHADHVGWRAYNGKRAKRGVDEWIRRNAPPTEDLWLLHYNVRRLRDRQEADRIMAYIMGTQAIPPYSFTHGYWDVAKDSTYSDVRIIRDEN